MLVPVVITLFLHQQGVASVAVRYFNTTTLDEQASYSLERTPPDRTILRFPGHRPNVFDSASSSGAPLGVYVKPPHIRVHRRPPPYHHHYNSFSNLQSYPSPPHPPKYYYPYEPGYPGYNEGVYPEEDCNALAPLLGLKASLIALFKLAIVKLPLLAIKFLAKVFAVLVILGPLLIPLLLLFPVPVFGFNNFGNGIAVTGFGGNGFNNNNGNGFNNNGNNNNNNNGGNRLQGQGVGGNRFQGSQGGREAILARLPLFAKGPCLPRLSCEMGFWGYREQVAWILDHATETATPTFPKIFNTWKRAYNLGGKGRDCSTLYDCPTVDNLIAAAKKYNLLDAD